MTSVPTPPGTDTTRTLSTGGVAPGPAPAGPAALSQATHPRQGVPSGGRVALIPLSATRPIPHGAEQ